jgi:hypothetical protein
LEGTTDYAIIKINNVSNLDTGQFDLSFNSSVLKVVNVEDGDIQGTGIPIQWHLIDIDTLRMIFNLEGVNGITGSGQLAIIEFEVIGHGDTTLYISSQITSFKFLSLLWSSPFSNNKFQVPLPSLVFPF